MPTSSSVSKSVTDNPNHIFNLALTTIKADFFKILMGWPIDIVILKFIKVKKNLYQILQE